MSWLDSINNIIWGLPMVSLLSFTHIYFTFKTNFVQRHIFTGIKASFSKNAFETLSTTLAATLGTGNIIGMSTAIYLGGPGAVFWCLITGVLGMATCYSECFLGVLFRDKDSRRGGPMYTLKNGLCMKKCALLFSIFTILASFGTGCTTQSNALCAALNSGFGVPKIIGGAICAFLVCIIIHGGFNGIAKVCRILVPFMTVFFVGGCVTLLFLCRDYILPACNEIIASAFSKSAMIFGTGGGLTGMLLSVRYGMSRGLFTNEAGLGSTAIAAATSEHTPHTQGLISMSSIFWDTIIMCTLTGLTIVSCGLKYPSRFSGAGMGNLMDISYGLLGKTGGVLLNISIILFAFATLNGWYYFGESSVYYIASHIPNVSRRFFTASHIPKVLRCGMPQKYIQRSSGRFSHKKYIQRSSGRFSHRFMQKHYGRLSHKSTQKCSHTEKTLLSLYRFMYSMTILFGAVMSLDLVWELCDIFNALMACPNILSLILLRNKLDN